MDGEVLLLRRSKLKKQPSSRAEGVVSSTYRCNQQAQYIDMVRSFHYTLNNVRLQLVVRNGNRGENRRQRRKKDI
jgi:hypothetical protein